MQPQNTPLDHLSVVEFRGPDAAAFLHGQLSSNIQGLAPSGTLPGCLCNPAGRVRGLLLLHRGPEGYLALCARTLRDTLADGLRRFVLRARVEILPRPDLSVTAGGGSAPPGADGTDIAFGALTYRVAGDQPGSGAGNATGALEAWRERELRHGLFWLGPGTTEQFLPQMLGMQHIGALDFRKGCFPGQEIIARTRYLGKLKRHPLLCQVGGPAAPGAMEAVELRSGGETAGAVVVDHAGRPDGPTLMALVMRADEAFRPDTLCWGDRALAVEWSAPPDPAGHLD